MKVFYNKINITLVSNIQSFISAIIETTDFNMETTSIKNTCPQYQFNIYVGVLAGALSVTLMVVLILVFIVAILIAKMRKKK